MFLELVFINSIISHLPSFSLFADLRVFHDLPSFVINFIIFIIFIFSTVVKVSSFCIIFHHLHDFFMIRHYFHQLMIFHRFSSF